MIVLISVNFYRHDKLRCLLQSEYQKTEKSGLGLGVQKAIVEHYAKVDGATIIQVFMEAESGKEIENRYILQQAINLCLTYKCTLVVAKLDRLSRDVEHIFAIKKKLGNCFKSCDLPNTDIQTVSPFPFSQV